MPTRLPRAINMMPYPIDLHHIQGEIAEITCPLINDGKPFQTPATVVLTYDLFVCNSKMAAGENAFLVTLERGLKVTISLSPQGSGYWLFACNPEGWTGEPLLIIRTFMAWNGGSLSSNYYYGYPLVVDTVTWAGPWQTLGNNTPLPAGGAGVVACVLPPRPQRRWRTQPVAKSV